MCAESDKWSECPREREREGESVPTGFHRVFCVILQRLFSKFTMQLVEFLSVEFLWSFCQ